MTGIIDTSSLVAVARYYLSIKDETKLLYFLESKFRSGDLILLETIRREASYTHQGLTLSLMEFLNDSKLIVSDSGLLPPSPQKFSNQLDNNFCIALQKKRLSEEQYEQQKSAYMLSGDARMILYALNNIGSDPIIITEETPRSNDGKLFRKLPAICDMLSIRHTSIAGWLSSNGVELSWSHPVL